MGGWPERAPWRTSILLCKKCDQVFDLLMLDKDLELGGSALLLYPKRVFCSKEPVLFPSECSTQSVRMQWATMGHPCALRRRRKLQEPQKGSEGLYVGSASKPMNWASCPKWNLKRRPDLEFSWENQRAYQTNSWGKYPMEPPKRYMIIFTGSWEGVVPHQCGHGRKEFWAALEQLSGSGWWDHHIVELPHLFHLSGKLSVCLGLL